jgi:hypothetical protein
MTYMSKSGTVKKRRKEKKREGKEEYKGGSARRYDIVL